MACIGGFKDAANLCYTPYAIVDQPTGLIDITNDPVCDVTTQTTCKTTTDFFGTATGNNVACLCKWGLNLVAGRCAWTGDQAYLYNDYYRTLNRAIEGSFDCHFKAFDFLLNRNFFDGNDLFSVNVKFEGFANWYKCINESVRVTHVMHRMRDIFYLAGNSSVVY
jgi:hypothetical protein